MFLSYASENRPRAEEIALALEGEGHDVFFDRSDLVGGENFNAVIRGQIEKADLLVFLITPESVREGSYSLTELRMARERWTHPRGHVLPVMLEPTEMERIPVYLRGVTFFQPEGSAAAEIVAHVGRRRRRPGPVTLAAVAAVAIAIVAFGWIALRETTFVSQIDPRDFVGHFVFDDEDIERTEYRIDPTASFPADGPEVVRLERVAFGYLETTDRPGAFNISVGLTNTTERPIQLDLSPRFFALADDQGRKADLVYFCCEAKGELLGAGSRRQIQLVYRCPPGWEGKEITIGSIEFRITGLTPLSRGAWRFRPLATAE